MKSTTLIAAAALIAAANGFALVHVARNRAGRATAELTLTDREFYYYEDPEQSAVSLHLAWTDPDQGPYPHLPAEPYAWNHWLDATKLAELGFDVSMPPSDREADRFYERQLARTGFAALEYDGTAWQAWATMRRSVERQQPSTMKTDVEEELRSSTHLVAIDVASDADALRARHPDEHSVVIVPAFVRIGVRTARPAVDAQPAEPATLVGTLSDIPADIHVPRPFSDAFHAHGTHSREHGREDPLYRVTLRYGSLLEPWVTAIEFDEHADAK
jgi:hypothetical protein